MAKGFGVPVITTSVGGLAEVVIDGRTGFLVPPADPEGLAATITRYFQEAHKTGMMQEIARSTGDFSWDSVVWFLTQVVEKG
jgi:glycosyltransferase involved in cell wall biosynthesis